MLQNIKELTEEAAEKYGYRTFAIDPENRVNFRTFRDRAEQAGNRIRQITVAKDCGYPVAVYGEKSTELLTAMFGAVYAGAFYVVLNPEQPAERLNQILEVLKPRLLICADPLFDAAASLSCSCRRISYSTLFADVSETAASAGHVTRRIEDAAGKSRLPVSTDSARNSEDSKAVQEQKTPAAMQEQDEAILPKEPGRDDPLYGIFTSGSTGTPKCVLISHGDVLDFIGHFAEAFHFTERDVIGNQAPFDFDVSVKDIYTALMTGASIVLIPREYFSTPARLLDYICDHGVTSLTWAVSALCIVSMMKGFSYRVPDKLVRVMFSGEVMPLKQLRIWQENVPDALYVNLYGPTEITCNCTYYVIPTPYTSDAPLPVGVPFPGREVTIRDEKGRVLTEPGSRGEICVAGESLAIGYYRNPTETAKHFISDPSVSGGRLYRTGDMAEIGSDGAVRFSGRKDFQIKHMGHRIELEEIEKDVESEPGIDRCICAYDEAKKRITAFYTGTVEKKALHIELKEKLPLYMVPNKFMHVKAFALNKNGKIDRKALGGLELAE